MHSEMHTWEQSDVEVGSNCMKILLIVTLVDEAKMCKMIMFETKYHLTFLPLFSAIKLICNIQFIQPGTERQRVQYVFFFSGTY